jgi:hypothetical protein
LWAGIFYVAVPLVVMSSASPLGGESIAWIGFGLTICTGPLAGPILGIMGGASGSFFFGKLRGGFPREVVISSNVSLLSAAALAFLIGVLVSPGIIFLLGSAK